MEEKENIELETSTNETNEEKGKKKYSNYKIIDLILGPLSICLVFLMTTINLNNPFGIVTSIIEGDLFRHIIGIIIVVFLLLEDALCLVYFVYYVSKKKFLNTPLNDFVSLSYLIPFVITLLLLISTLFSVSQVDGRSMNPTLYEGDTVIFFNTKEFVDDGDIVVYYKNKGEKDEKFIIKRLIAEGGDTITIQGDTIKINDNDPVKLEGNSSRFVQYESYTLKENEIFLLGDNGSESQDSRYDGLLNRENLIGKVIKVIK